MSNQAPTAPNAPGSAPTAPGGPEKKKFKKTGNEFVDGLSDYDFDAGTRFFQDHILGATPSGKFAVDGRILPARNPALLGKPEYETSVLTYRLCNTASLVDQSMLDADRNVPKTTNWFVGMLAVRMFGSNTPRHDIVSPRTRKVYPGFKAGPDDLACPFHDIRHYVKKLAEEDEALTDRYLKGADAKTAPIVPQLKTFLLCNMWGLVGTDAHRNNASENFLGFITDFGFKNMLDRLTFPPAYGTASRDPNFPEFMLGDVTDPKTGLWAWGQQVQEGVTTPWSWTFSKSPNTLDGSSVVVMTDEILAKRYALDHTLFNILSYQEIVDIICEDKSIPHRFVETACAHRAKVTAYKENTTYSFGNPAANGPSAAPAGKLYYVFNAGVTDPTPVTLAQIVVVLQTKPQAMFCEQGKQEWQTAQQVLASMVPAGPVNQGPPTPPTAPQLPTPPQAPSAPTPPVQPAAPTPPPQPAAPAPQRPAPPTPPAEPTPAPVTPADTRMFWVSQAGKVSDGCVNVAAAKDVAANAPKALFCEDGTEKWQTAEQLGWATARAAAPQPPTGPTAPQAPATSPAEAAPNGMTPEEAAEYDQLTAALAVPGVVPQMDQVTRLMALEQKKSGK